MSIYRSTSGLLAGLFLTSTLTLAQQQTATEPADTLTRARNERPEKPTFIAELDQRFTLFRDTRSEQGRPTQVNLWGARAGFLLPSNVKIGVGYYFTYQDITESEHQWREFQLVDRNIRFATVYVEKFFFRRKHWEFSALAGYRFSVRRDFPASPVNWNGLYYSIGPGFFLDRFTEDFSNWRQKRKARRQQRD